MHPFRQGLLKGRSIALAGAVPGSVTELLLELGARVAEPSAQDFDAFICAAGADGQEALLEREWDLVSTVAAEAFIPAKAGRIVLLAPRDEGGVIKAALENLARTLSVEWARYGITTTALAPGSATTDEEIATVVAYLCSPAGAYFSGCRLDMRLRATRTGHRAPGAVRAR